MSDDDESQNNPGPAPDAAESMAESPPPAAEPAPPPSRAEEKLAALEAEKAELKDRMLRIAADFDNYKKRMRKEMSENEVKAREVVLRDFLEIADNLERAIVSWNVGGEKDVKSVQDGVELVLRLFKSKLERYSVTAIESKGQPFDPRVHDAISQAPSADAVPGTVLHELQKGYQVGERLLRPAVVVVATAPPGAQKGKGEPGAGGNGVDLKVDGEDEAADGSAAPGKGDKTS